METDKYKYQNIPEINENTEKYFWCHLLLLWFFLEYPLPVDIFYFFLCYHTVLVLFCSKLQAWMEDVMLKTFKQVSEL